MEVPREEMDRHCETVCGKRAVPCPFQAVGCEEPLLQGDLVQHCQEWMEKHLYFTFLSHEKVATMVMNQQGRLLQAEQEARMVKQTHEIDTRAITNTVRQTEAKVSALEADIKKLLKDVKQVDSNNLRDISNLRNELKAVRPPA
eukprot:TRINITY_DN19110_c0_g1_i1.p1 TRINITY_DN19110_c0_g1~~TRINITY_DN19110_c0_g1_i1.p1  ORF type:complete len:144 (+),score=43.51 TRINITY_DN19110_c0_g1_i1:132-563(+)